MVISGRVRVGPAERVESGETPLEGLLRLREERDVLVWDTDVREWNRILRENMGRISGGLRDAQLSVVDCDPVRPLLIEEEPRQSKTMLVLESRGTKIAQADVVVRKREGGVEALIEEFQGMDSKEGVDGFREDNNVHWNIFLVNTVKDAAYESGFSRVLLRDITTTENYEKPSTVARPGVTPDEMRERMRQLYTRTRKECQFTQVLPWVMTTFEGV